LGARVATAVFLSGHSPASTVECNGRWWTTCDGARSMAAVTIDRASLRQLRERLDALIGE